MQQAGNQEERGLVSRIGPLEVDWPKSVGYFGAIGSAIACDLIAPPIGVFIAAIPVLKLFKHPGQPWPLRIVTDTLEGAAKPIGGDAEASVRLAPDASAEETPGASRRRARRTGRSKPRQLSKA
jgi:hypothetical protein